MVEENLENNIMLAKSELLEKISTIKLQLEKMCPACPIPESFSNNILTVLQNFRSLVSHKGVFQIKEGVIQRFNLLIHETRLLLDSLPIYTPMKTHIFLPRWPIAVFIACAMACLLFSTSFHLFLCRSESTCSQLQKLDFAGIAALIVGSSIPCVYYGFYCHA